MRKLFGDRKVPVEDGNTNTECDSTRHLTNISVANGGSFKVLLDSIALWVILDSQPPVDVESNGSFNMKSCGGGCQIT